MAEVGQLRGVAPEYVDEIKELFRRLFEGPLPDQLEGGQGVFPLFDSPERLVEKAREMAATFNDKSWRYSLPFLYVARSALDRVFEILPRLLDWIDDALDRYFPVVSLYRAAATWTSDVMTPLSEITGTIGRDLDRAGLDWHDAGREIYSEDVVPHQRDAAAAAKDNAAYISRMLADIGQANTDYATDLILHVAEIYAGIVRIIVELASVVGSPFAIQDAAGLIETSITNFVGRVTGAVDSFASAVTEIQHAENELSDHTYFPGGEWPRAVDRA